VRAITATHINIGMEALGLHRIADIQMLQKSSVVVVIAALSADRYRPLMFANQLSTSEGPGKGLFGGKSAKNRVAAVAWCPNKQLVFPNQPCVEHAVDMQR
jgi:hypothetical protein